MDNLTSKLAEGLRALASSLEDVSSKEDKSSSDNYKAYEKFDKLLKNSDSEDKSKDKTENNTEDKDKEKDETGDSKKDE